MAALALHRVQCADSVSLLVCDPLLQPSRRGVGVLGCALVGRHPGHALADISPEQHHGLRLVLDRMSRVFCIREAAWRRHWRRLDAAPRALMAALSGRGKIDYVSADQVPNFNLFTKNQSCLCSRPLGPTNHREGQFQGRPGAQRFGFPNSYGTEIVFLKAHAYFCSTHRMGDIQTFTSAGTRG